MKEVIFNNIGGFDALNVVEAEIPTPDANEVVVKSVAIGVNPVDNLRLFGLYPGGEITPHRLGTDASGTIHTVGSDVTNFKAGDRVWVYFPDYHATGTYAEYFKCSSTCVSILPSNVDLKVAAGIGIPYVTADRCLRQVNARPTEVILVNGASGAVGRAAVQMGRMIGMTVIGTAGNEENLKIVKDLGAHHVLNYKDPELKDKIMKITNGKGANVILEPVADVNVPCDVECVAEEGRITIFGAQSATASFEIFSLIMKRAAIYGQGCFFATKSQIDESVAYINAGLRSECLTPTIGHEFPLNDVRKALEFLKSGKAKGKVVLIP